MPEDEILIPAETDPEDRVRSTMMAAAEAIPIAGSIGSTIIGELWIEPYRKRVTVFAESVADAIAGLSIRVDQIADAEHLQSIAARAVQAAARTNEAEKLRMLRNAVVNVALGTDRDEIWDLILVDLVDELTEAHLVTLAFLDDILDGRRARNLKGGVDTMTRDELVAEQFDIDDTDLVRRILRDLEQHELTHNLPSLVAPGEGTTDIGKRLLRFVAEIDLNPISNEPRNEDQ